MSDQEKDRYNILCPYCDTVNSKVLELKTAKQFINCSSCDKPFYTKFYLVRSKRSKMIKDKTLPDYREFNIRVYSLDGDEQYITFLDYNGNDMEMRSKDLLSLTYNDKNDLCTMSNQTINLHMKINRGGFERGCLQVKNFVVGAVVIGVVVLLIKFFSC